MRTARVLGSAIFLFLLLLATPSHAQGRAMALPGECGASCGLIPDGNGGFIDCGPCMGWCGDGVCDDGFGENHVNCPDDCSGGTCQSEGCQGRCGLVHDQCGHVIHCGACNSTCGDGICDPDEIASCSDDCGANCHPLHHCGLRCGTVSDGCGSYLDCGPCDEDCGNGACEPGENHATCAQDCPAAGCVSAGCAGGCGLFVDNCGNMLACGTCGSAALCPNPSGICEPDLGEDHWNCRWECAVSCGNGTCDNQLELFKCPSDCANAPAPDGITAGGPYTGEVGDVIQFYGLVGGNLSASSYAWTFGDGATATTLSPAHTYTAAGVYPVTFRVTTTAGFQLDAATTASIGAIAQTNGFDADFVLKYNAPLDSLEARASIRYTGPAPPAPLTVFVSISIWNPLGELVYRSPLTVAVAEADAIIVPELLHPMPGNWLGRADYAYRLEGDPTLTFLGSLGDSELVPTSANCSPLSGATSPESPLEECTVKITPTDVVLRDGQTQRFTAEPPTGPGTLTFNWGYQKPANSSSVGSLEFTGNTATEDARATWFANPDEPCADFDTRVAQALENAKYTVLVGVTGGSQPASGKTSLIVKMPWGVPKQNGGAGKAAVTLSPNVNGIPSTHCPEFPSQSNPCRVTGKGSLERTQPFICFADSVGRKKCDDLKEENGGLMPRSSSFFHKAEVHENKHVSQWSFGQLMGDLLQVEQGACPLMTCVLPNGGPSLINLTATSQIALDVLIENHFARWIKHNDRLDASLVPASETEADIAANDTPPTYLFQYCP